MTFSRVRVEMSGVSSARSIAELARVMARIKGEFPSFRVVYKDSFRLMTVIDILLKIITFGQMKWFLTKFTTTIGNTVYVTRSWSEKSGYAKAATLRHEAVHMRQRARMGDVRYTLSYLVWIFPVGLALGRRNLEREAYEESLRAYNDYYSQKYLLGDSLKEQVISHFTGPSYFWMWPFRKSCERWYDRVVSEIVEGSSSG